MELEFQISIKDSMVEIRFASIENFIKAIPAFIENENTALKAQKLVRKIIKINKALSSLFR